MTVNQARGQIREMGGEAQFWIYLLMWDIEKRQV